MDSAVEPDEVEHEKSMFVDGQFRQNPMRLVRAREWNREIELLDFNMNRMVGKGGGDCEVE